MPTMFAAMWAYVGSETLADLAKGWGVEVAAFPGSEVDPGLLQVKRLSPSSAIELEENSLEQAEALQKPSKPTAEHLRWRQKGMGSRIVHDDEFGETRLESKLHADRELHRDQELLRLMGLDQMNLKGVSDEDALANHVRSLFGAIYLHEGHEVAKQYFEKHILSRHLNISSLFKFKYPTRDLSLLCAREGFEAPVARLIAETGRKSRHPVFVVGVFSGNDKLGEGSGGSLDEARIKASVNALKSWYLYSPQDGNGGRVPSDTATNPDQEFKSIMIDGGEVIG
jgi:dsRNA-specific ribonuclease